MSFENFENFKKFQGKTILAIDLGTTITGFSEMKSVQKTLRKPAEQLKAFKDAGKVVLRKFLEEINAVDTKMNGRINEDIMLLKVQ